MKIISIALLCLLFSQQVVAQNFSKEFEVTLPDSLQTGHLSWADIDNDGLLDVLDRKSVV